LIVGQVPDSYQSWKQDRLDLAEHFFAMIDLAHARRTSAVAEEMVDLFFEIGKSLFDKGCCDMAMVWLRRALELLKNQDLGSLSLEVSELRLNLLHTYG
jgi:Meiosis protein SPO22/ZIP4 like